MISYSVGRYFKYPDENLWRIVAGVFNLENPARQQRTTC